MKFGLSEEQYQFVIEQVVKPLENQGAQIWCYGSRARGSHKKFSDLDLMVESDKDLSQIISNIQEILSKSNFPYKVDLVDYKNFANSYKEQYQKDKIRF